LAEENGGKVKAIYGMRAFYALGQDNSVKYTDEWYENMFALENSFIIASYDLSLNIYTNIKDLMWFFLYSGYCLYYPCLSYLINKYFCLSITLFKYFVASSFLPRRINRIAL